MKSAPVKLAKNLTVEFSMEGNELTVQWDPDMRQTPGRKITQRYRLARDTFLHQVAAARDVRLAVVDEDGARMITPDGAGARGATQ